MQLIAIQHFLNLQRQENESLFRFIVLRLTANCFVVKLLINQQVS